MKKFGALYIKLLRTRYDYSYRQIAIYYGIRYGINDTYKNIGIQQVGTNLCNEAMDLLGEKDNYIWFD